MPEKRILESLPLDTIFISHDRFPGWMGSMIIQGNDKDLCLKALDGIKQATTVSKVKEKQDGIHLVISVSNYESRLFK